MPPPSPPKLDDILSQMSQRDVSSTQLFRSNSEYFNNARTDHAPSKVTDISSFNKRGGTFQSSYGSQLNSVRGDWLTSGSQQTYSRYHQASQEANEEDEADYGEEEFIQDSPELFTQRNDFNLQGAPFTTSDLESMGSSDGMKTPQLAVCSHQLLKRLKTEISDFSSFTAPIDSVEVCFLTLV